MKKLRYASDFFGHIFAGHKAKTHLSSFEACLDGVQDRLGALNDITVHRQLTRKLVAGKPNTKVRARAFAVGIVSDCEQRKNRTGSKSCEQ